MEKIYEAKKFTVWDKEKKESNVSTEIKDLIVEKNTEKDYMMYTANLVSGEILKGFFNKPKEEKNGLKFLGTPLKDEVTHRLSVFENISKKDNKPYLSINLEYNDQIHKSFLN